MTPCEKDFIAMWDFKARRGKGGENNNKMIFGGVTQAGSE